MHQIRIAKQYSQIPLIRIDDQNQLPFSIINLQTRELLMQKKEKQLSNLKCPQGNQAVFACANFYCSKLSLICQVKQCKCQNSHKLCVTQTELSKLKNRLQDKGQTDSLALEEIYKWYENQMKLIQVEMEQLKVLIDKKEVVLLDNQNRLYSLLIQEKSQLIIPQLVSYVLRSLEKQPIKKDGIKEKMEEVKKQLVVSDKQLKTTLQKVNKMIDNKLKSIPSSGILIQDIKWSYDFHHPNLGLQNFKTIQVNIATGSYYSAFVEPAIFRNKYKNVKITFKLNQITSKQLSLGVCQIPANFKMADINLYNKIEQGSISFYTGAVYIGKTQGHKKQNTSINAYANNDLIEVEYQIQTQKVTIKNITQNTQGVTYIKTDINQPLYFVIQLCHQNDSVQIVEGKYYQ